MSIALARLVVNVIVLVLLPGSRIRSIRKRDDDDDDDDCGGKMRNR